MHSSSSSNNEELIGGAMLSRSNSTPTSMNPNSLKDNNSNEESDIEKRRRSIQHVLSSPNLTAREKQFLMKSALSNNIKPMHSPTAK